MKEVTEQQYTEFVSNLVDPTIETKEPFCGWSLQEHLVDGVPLARKLTNILTTQYQINI